MAMVNSFGLWTLSDEVLTFIYEEIRVVARRGERGEGGVKRFFFTVCVVRIPTYER